jgi:GH25 family lysozyme M1 (1,4-beta-N-acetylmuramidase)
VSIVTNVSEALARCASTTRWEVGMCGQFCAAMYGYGASGYRDALTQWQETPGTLRRPGATDAPPGALLFWGGGSAGHGHVAVADGGGGCWSIDIAGAGTVAHVSAGTITARWGLPYLGWAAPYFQGDQWTPMSIYGVDVSAYQPINFALTTPSDGKPVDFAIIKVTESTNWESSRWKGQQLWARDHDLAVGYYHFARPGNMIAQADYFLGKIANLAPGETLWFDWEDSGVSSAQKDQWIKYVQSKRPGFRVGLYCNTSFWKSIDTSSFAGDGLWIATGGYPAGTPPIQSPWLIHQYSTAGGYDHDTAAFDSRAAMLDWAGGDVALSADDKAWILANVPKAVFTTDGILESPADASDHTTNPFWTLESFVKDTSARVRQATSSLTTISAQAKANGSGISAAGQAITGLSQSLTAANTKLDTVLSVINSLNLDELPAEVAAKLNGLKFVLLEEGN